MANIDHYLEDIELASRGEEVRDSIIDAFEALNSEGPGTMDWDNITDTPDTLTGYGVSEVPASMVSGVLALNNIPPSALERMVPVADDTARFALTSSDVQNGDTVKVLSTLKLYLVVDDTSLSTEAGYEEYKAGTADSVDWSGVLNTPDTLAGYGIEDAYTKDEVDDITTSDEEESDAGNPITIETDAAQYAKKTHLTLEPVQDLHGYDHPWPAGGGKNIADPSAFTFVSVSENNGIYTASDADTASTLVFKIQQYNNNSFVSGTTITSSAITTAQRISLQTTIDASTNRIKFANNGQTREFSVFIPIDSSLIGETVTFSVDITDATIGACKFKNIMLEKGSTATSFAPYSNICPISGLDEVEVKATGFNQWDEEWETGAYGNNGEPVSNTNQIRSKNYIHVLPSTTYYMVASAGNRICFYDSDKMFINVVFDKQNNTFTTPANCNYIRFNMADSYGTPYNHDICINISDAEKNGTYEPYTESVSSLNLPEPVYSGTLDLETGEVVADMGIVKITDFSHFNYQAYTNYVALYAYYNTLGVPKPKIYPDTSRGKGVSDSFKYIDTGTGQPFGTFSIYPSNDGILYFWNNNGVYTNETEMRAAMTNIAPQLVYELATPIIYQLTPQQLTLFKGINNISANAKTVQVTYRNGELATTENIVDAVEVAKQNAIGESASYTDDRLATELAPILGDLATAETSPTSASHAVGEYLLYNKHLYKVLAAISAGQQLTIGTNIEQTSVAAELTRLNSLLT